MRLMRYVLVSTCIAYVFLNIMVGFSHFHRVIFQDEVCIVPAKGYNYRTCQDMRVLIDNKVYIVPKKFTTDLASIPRGLWFFLAPQYSGFVAPAILHDYLYRCNNHISRKFADEVLYSALISENVSSFTAYKFYLGVRLFGDSHFINGVCKDA